MFKIHLCSLRICPPFIGTKRTFSLDAHGRDAHNPHMTLIEYMSTHRVTSTALAQQLGVSHSTVLRWASGTMSPPMRRIPAIQAATDGHVTAQDFVPVCAQ